MTSHDLLQKKQDSNQFARFLYHASGHMSHEVPDGFSPLNSVSLPTKASFHTESGCHYYPGLTGAVCVDRRRDGAVRLKHLLCEKFRNGKTREPVQASDLPLLFEWMDDFFKTYVEYLDDKKL